MMRILETRRKEPMSSTRTNQKSPRGDKASQSPIYVVVVEYHQHALEHIHSILRRRKSLDPWSMLHFDAHPDLACPSNNVPALCCFFPRQDAQEKDLYSLLDSHSSGIAEWILPLVLAGGLERVHWIKPPESRQLPVGKHEYNIGAWIPSSPLKSPPRHGSSFMDLPPSARVRVDWKHPYYLDDACVVARNELLFPQKLQLTVSEMCNELEHEEALLDATTGPFLHQDWALDVCLDYFCCQNPFITDIEAIDERFAEALVNAVTSTRMYTCTDGDSLREPANYERELARFQTAFQQLLQERNDSSITKLLKFYESKRDARRLLEKVAQSLAANPGDTTDKLTTMAMEALPNLCMPHDPKSSIDELKESTQIRLEAFSRMLQCTRKDSGDPFFITVARSTLDGFTPSSVVEKLQDQVLVSVHDTYCGCDRIRTHGTDAIRPDVFSSQAGEPCRLRAIFDYGEWEGASFQ